MFKRELFFSAYEIQVLFSNTILSKTPKEACLNGHPSLRIFKGDFAVWDDHTWMKLIQDKFTVGIQTFRIKSSKWKTQSGKSESRKQKIPESHHQVTT